MSDRMFIASGGLLMDTKWVYDREKGAGEYVTTDITGKAPTKLFEACELADDVTLRDVFLLLAEHMDIYKVVINNWVDEIVDEAFNREPTDYYCSEDDKIQYLELDWVIEHCQKENWAANNIMPSFHGWGTWSDGCEGGFSLMLTPACDIIDIPLRLNPAMTFYPSIMDDDFRERESIIINGPLFSLGQIFHGIIWELSFCGPPERRDEESEKLQDNYDDYQSQMYEEDAAP